MVLVGRFAPRERGRPISVYAIGPLMGTTPLSPPSPSLVPHACLPPFIMRPAFENRKKMRSRADKTNKGPFLGSVIGSYIVLYDWRWCFILMTILVGINTLVLVFAMEETYAEYVPSLPPSLPLSVSLPPSRSLVVWISRWRRH